MIAGMVVSFLLVLRINSGLTTYSESSGYIGIMYLETREIVQKALLCTATPEAKRILIELGKNGAVNWHTEPSCFALDTTVANISYPSRKIPIYEIPKLSRVDLQCATPNQEFLWLANIPSSEETDSVRVPKCTRDGMLAGRPNVAPNHTAIDKFQGGNSGMQKFMVCACRVCVGMEVAILTNVVLFSLPDYRPRQCHFPWFK
jgi:hypothetical protein